MGHSMEAQRKADKTDARQTTCANAVNWKQRLSDTMHLQMYRPYGDLNN